MHLQSAQIWPVCNKGSQFYLPPTHEPYLPLLPSRKESPPFGWYSLRLPTKRWPDWVDLGGWSHTEINVPHRKLNPDTVIHPSRLLAGVRCRLTSLMETNALPLRQTASETLGFQTVAIDLQIGRSRTTRDFAEVYQRVQNRSELWLVHIGHRQYRPAT